MPLRESFSDQLKTAMKAGDAARISTLRMILAKLKDTDIAARPKGVDKVPDEEIMAMLRGMVKPRRESVELYRQGNRQELAAKEEAEIAVIESFLPRADGRGRTGERRRRGDRRDRRGQHQGHGQGDGARCKAKHGATLDMASAGPLVKARLGVG